MTRSAPAEPARDGHAVLGTAGHIDHGKTALIRALTGVDTDRLPEEQARGITIELGFADLVLDDGRHVSVVDVPGHERLVRTMISGASGIDLVLLVVAADEGVMPQTREHVAICDLLGLARCVVAVTKVDLVDEETAELAEEEVRDLLAATRLEPASCHRVSAVDGRGLEALRGAIGAALDQAGARTPRSGPPRLPVDRCFTMRGFGAVVTGTLIGGALEVGQELELQPGGRRTRIRGLQRHGEPAQRVWPGTRCAVNLQGIDAADVERGQVLGPPGALAPSDVFDVEVQWLPGAPEGFERLAVELVAGPAHRRARLLPIGGPRFVAGTTRFARLHLDGDPLPLWPGDRLVLRGFARSQGAGGTLGGAVVLDPSPPRRSRLDPRLLRDLDALRGDDPLAALRTRVERSGLAGITTGDLARETGWIPSDLAARLRKLAAGGAVVEAGRERWLGPASLERLEGGLRSALEAFHRREPLRPGMPRGALRGRLPENVPGEAADLALDRLAAAGELVLEADGARLAGFEPVVDPETRALLERMTLESARAGLEPPPEREWAERLGLELSRFRDLAAHLERQGAWVRAPGDLWYDAPSVSELRDRVVAHLARHGELSTPDYKRIIGTTRRTAVPLMELLDEWRVTRRRGDVRVLLAAPR
ncbi:MAG: selenocysteine-specific translation elongation factor [Myxococcota bacterium]